MNKFYLSIAVLCASLCAGGACAQEPVRRVFTLDEIFDLADCNSKTLRPSFTAIDEAHEAVRVAKNDRLPDIDASLSFSYLGDGTLMERDFTQVERAPMPHFGNNFALEVSQIIYSGGAVSNGIAIAQLQEQNARLDWAKDRNKVRFLLAGYYFDLFKQLNLIKVYEQNIEQTKQLLKDIRAKQGEGLALKNDITRYELLLSDLEFTVVQIKNTLGILNRNLVTNLGLDESVWIEPDTTLLSRTLPMGDAAYWQNEAMENSPELKQLALAVQMNKHQDKIVKSDRLPKIALMAGNHFDGPITIEVPPINKNFNYWYVGVGISYNLASLYKTNKAASRSKLTIRRTQERYDDASEQTGLAVQAAYVRYIEAYEQLVTRKKNVELAGQNYAVIANRYKNELALITDMLDASNSKLSAEVQLANAQIDIAFNYYKLLYLTGTL